MNKLKTLLVLPLLAMNAYSHNDNLPEYSYRNMIRFTYPIEIISPSKDEKVRYEINNSPVKLPLPKVDVRLQDERPRIEIKPIEAEVDRTKPLGKFKFKF